MVQGGAAPYEEVGMKMDLEQEVFLQADQPMLEEAEGMEEVFASLTSMKTEVELMRKPLGTFESPARTCKELMMIQHGYRDGQHITSSPSYHTDLPSSPSIGTLIDVNMYSAYRKSAPP